MTNWAIQNERKNIHNVLDEKDFIGIGCEWTYKKLCNFSREHPINGFSVDDSNEQLHEIALRTAQTVAQVWYATISSRIAWNIVQAF